MGLFDKAKELAGSAANIASDAAVQKAEEMRQASIEKRQERAAMKQAAKDEARAFGKRIMTVDGEEKGSSITLYEGGIEFSSKDEELQPGKRLFAEISSVAIEDAEELQQRVTVTRLLLVGVFAFALKKKKGGTKFITVEGDDYLWPIEIGRKNVKDAQKFVMKARALMKSAK